MMKPQKRENTADLISYRKNKYRTNKMKTIKLTVASLNLLKSLVNDACNWSGTPMINITKEERGNLTALKRAGLLKTSIDEGIQYANFTAGHFAINAGDIKFYYSALESGPMGDMVIREM